MRTPLFVLGCWTCALVISQPAQSEQSAEEFALQTSAFGDAGAILSRNELASIDLAQVHNQVENAIGLTTATVTVMLVQPVEGVTTIPWRSNAQPLIRIALPKPWVLKRASQMGDEATALYAIENIVKQTVPGAAFEIELVEFPPTAKTTEPTSEGFAKQLVVMFGLISLLLLGFIVNRRKIEFDHLTVPSERSIEQEAIAILNMDYSMARQKMDGLVGARKIAVLREIVSSVDQQEAAPLVQVPRQQTIELSPNT